VTKMIGEDRGVNIRMHTIEDAARLAMGDFVTDDRPADSANAANASFRIAWIAGGVLVAAILGMAYL
jgi:hypothetical protein